MEIEESHERSSQSKTICLQVNSLRNCSQIEFNNFFFFQGRDVTWLTMTGAIGSIYHKSLILTSFLQKSAREAGTWGKRRPIKGKTACGQTVLPDRSNRTKIGGKCQNAKISNATF